MSFYRHHATGELYEVLHALAEHTETEEKFVVYRNAKSHKVWVRPFEMFHGYTENGTKRFEKVDEV